MTLDRPALVADLKKLVSALEDDIRDYVTANEALSESLTAEHAAALEAGRTADTYSTWLDDQVTQASVAWVLGTVFVRFCEDNELIETPWLAGNGHRGQLAQENYDHFWQSNPTSTDRDWLLSAFDHLRQLPAVAQLYDERNPLYQLPLSADGAAKLRTFWLQTDAEARLTYDFASRDLDTRFLGDLYQDLSVSAQKKFALLQTPVFVEEFILDQTLEPALAEFGLRDLKLIDPTCGSGHFLLGAFQRLLDRWDREAPALDRRVRVQRALDHIHGADLNPFAVAIARFRLTIAALRASGLSRLADAPAFDYHLAVGDSLLGGIGHQGVLLDEGGGVAQHHYPAEDINLHPGILEPGRYHVVVGNPPYITVKDKALNQAYRDAYPMCAGKYALSVPFMELFFRLAVKGSAGSPAGYVGQITSNSFMKREFGKKVIETLLAGHDVTNPVDLTTVIDTSGAYIPGHGTPTVILIGRRRVPDRASTVRSVLGVRGEPGQPVEPVKGLVWTEIVERLEQVDFDGAYVTVRDLVRDRLEHFPWILNAGGYELVESMGWLPGLPAQRPLGERTYRIGFFGIQGNDQAYLFDARTVERRGLEGMRAEAIGESVRDFDATVASETFFPYNDRHELQPLSCFPNVEREMWNLRTDLGNRATFSKGTYFSDGRPWYEWHQLPKDRGAHSWSLAFAEVATHNHFVLDRGGTVFNRTAPVIKLPEGASEDDHLALVGLLNSSTACFWLKQVSYPKGGDPMGQDGARVSQQPWSDRYQFNATKLQDFPMPTVLPLEWGRRLDGLAQQLGAARPTAVCSPGAPTRQELDTARSKYESARGQMIAAQEELDWQVYDLYDLTDEPLTHSTGDLPEVGLGERAFEIVLARQAAAGEEETAWFERHGSTPITEIPAHWPQAYRDAVQRRIDLIESDKSIGLLERPEFKRRWAAKPWDEMQRDALRDWLLDRLEIPDLWRDSSGRPATQSVSQLASRLAGDTEFLSVLDLWVGTTGVDPDEAIGRLVADEHVPYLAALRYKAPGLRKRADWESTWELQRAEDRGEKVKVIPVPPKYSTGDFIKTSYWKHRGKLDVPKERFVSYPGAERGADRSLVLGWAGWDHAEQAQALAMLESHRATQDGWEVERLTPLLAGLAELEPWLHQWHSKADPKFGISPAQSISGILDRELARLTLTRDDLATWRPAPATRGRRSSPKGDS